jgi:hypothetical protein
MRKLIDGEAKAGANLAVRAIDNPELSAAYKLYNNVDTTVKIGGVLMDGGLMAARKVSPAAALES